MKILGIDTSCDDTCVSLIKVKNKKPDFEIISNIVSSQVKLHAKYGGVYPFLAKREHQKNLPIVFKKTTKGIDISKIDLIGVTIGPGLEPCLWQGVNFTKDLAEKLKKPLVAVNHIEAHIVVNFISKDIKNYFPAICLVVSGGHTQLILMRSIGKYKILGETRDDAAGECFDKVARILGLGYPGGPAIAEQARQWKSKNQKEPVKAAGWREGWSPKLEIKLPRPMIYQKNYDFSFSGLKTAVLYKVKSEKRKIKSGKYIREMCKETQQAIIDVLINKTLRAARDYKAKSIILGGGVAANEELRKQFQEKIKKELPNISYLQPETHLATDNALMVVVAAFFNKKEATMKWQKIKANANLKI